MAAPVSTKRTAPLLRTNESETCLATTMTKWDRTRTTMMTCPMARRKRPFRSWLISKMTRKTWSQTSKGPRSRPDSMTKSILETMRRPIQGTRMMNTVIHWKRKMLRTSRGGRKEMGRTSKLYKTGVLSKQ